MNKLKAGVSLGAVIGISACTTSPVVVTGPQSFSMSATRCGICVPVASYVTEQAGKYCQTQNKDIVVKSVTSNNKQPMFPGSATIKNKKKTHKTDTPPHRKKNEECNLETASPELDPIRHKVE